MHFLTGSCCSKWFHPRIAGSFSWMILVERLSDFSESVQENSLTSCPRLESFAFLMPQTAIELNIYPQIWHSPMKELTLFQFHGFSHPVSLGLSQSPSFPVPRLLRLREAKKKKKNARNPLGLGLFCWGHFNNSARGASENLGIMMCVIDISGVSISPAGYTTELDYHACFKV